MSRIYYELAPTKNPYQLLARAKILQALIDLGSKANAPYTKYNKELAYGWIFGTSTDFHFWCDMASVHPDQIRKKAKEALECGFVTRAAPGTGIRYEERRAYRTKAKLTRYKGIPSWTS